MLDDSKRWDLYHSRTSAEELAHSKYAEEKEKLFPRESIVVDMGGGVGNDAMYFLQQGHSVIILDISKVALEIAQRRAKKAGLDKKLITMQVDFGLHAIPVKDESVDIVYSRISLNYFGSNHTTKLFGDIKKMLKKGACAYLTFKSPQDIEEMEFIQKRATLYEDNVFIDNGQLRSRFTKQQLEEMLEAAGINSFRVEEKIEDLTVKGEGHKDKLYINEIIIEKL